MGRNHHSRLYLIQRPLESRRNHRSKRSLRQHRSRMIVAKMELYCPHPQGMMPSKTIVVMKKRRQHISNSYSIVLLQQLFQSLSKTKMTTACLSGQYEDIGFIGHAYSFLADYLPNPVFIAAVIIACLSRLTSFPSIQLTQRMI